MKKVAIIGAGNVGGEAAKYLANRGLAEIVLIDIVEGIAKGKALDTLHSGPIENSSISIIGGSDYSLIENSDVVIITAGKPRKPGMSREELLKVNFDIVSGISENVKKYAPNSVVIVVSNPLDAMVYTAYRVTGFPRERVIGMAGLLDSARFAAFIAQELGVSTADVRAMVLGTHGDLMVPMVRFATVSGIPAKDLIPEDRMKEIVNRTKYAGGEIVQLMGTSAWFAPGDAAAFMAEAVLLDTNRVLSASVYLKGEYGIDGVFVGVPVVLGKGGVKRIIELKLTEDEMEELRKSAEHIRKLQEEVDALLKGGGI
jgi:malate dehydrogenase